MVATNDNRKRLVVGRYHAALARRDDLVGVERKGACPTCSAHASAEELGAMGLGRVLQEVQVVMGRDALQILHARRMAVDMDSDDRSGAWRNRGLHARGIKAETDWLGIDESY